MEFCFSRMVLIFSQFGQTGGKSVQGQFEACLWMVGEEGKERGERKEERVSSLGIRCVAFTFPSF